MPRIRKEPKYLKNYYKKLDLRSISLKPKLAQCSRKYSQDLHLMNGKNL